MSDEHLLRLSEYKNCRANVNTASLIRDNIPILIMHPERFTLRKDNLEKKTLIKYGTLILETFPTYFILS